MDVKNISKTIIEKFYKVYKLQGYINEDLLFDSFAENDIPLYEIDIICENLLSMGVIINEQEAVGIENDGDVYDRSQTDYEKIYEEVIQIDKSLEDFINYVRKIIPPQRKELQYLIPQAKEGNLFAKQRIIEMYLRLVVKHSLWHNKNYMMPLAEAIQDGSLGLTLALDKYDASKKDNFSNHATLWIRQMIWRNAQTINPLIYMPTHFKDKLFSVYDLFKDCFTINCNCEMICQDRIEAVSKKLCCSLEEAEYYTYFLYPSESIEDMVEKKGHLFYEQKINEEEAYIDLIRDELKDFFANLLNSFPEREKKIIQLRYGFIDGNEKTLEEIGNLIGVTRERVRQIEKKALKQLRAPSKLGIIRGFY